MARDTKLLFSLIIDNSSSMKGEKIIQLNDALNTFINQIEQINGENAIEYSITVLDGFDAEVIKNFQDKKCLVSSIDASGLPFINKIFLLGMDGLIKRLKELNNSGIAYYKPWLIFLSDGYNVGDIEQSLQNLSMIHSKGLITYFPFAMTNDTYDESLSSLIKFKPPLVITKMQYHSLFKWLHELVTKRLATPLTETFKLDINSFEGWIEK